MRAVGSAILSCLLLAGCGSAAPPAAPPSPLAAPATVVEAPPGSAELSAALAPLAWWLGTWDADDGSAREQWVAASGAMYGVALDVGGGFEVMIVDDGVGLGKPDGIVRLYAMPDGKPALEFRQHELGAQAVTFRNDDAEPAKTIAYRRDGDALHAEVSNGERASPFHFRRAVGEPAPELEAADLAFAADTARRGVEGWMAAFEPDGWTIGGGEKVSGEGIRAIMTPFLEKVRLTWAPVASARRGDLGFTVGKATFTNPSEGSSWRGTYVTIWHRQPDGTWKVRFDTGRVVQE